MSSFRIELYVNAHVSYCSNMRVTSSMRVTTIGGERRFLVQMLKFVNTRTLRREDVTHMFEGLMYVPARDVLRVGPARSLNAEGYRQLQAALRGALDAIVSRDVSRMEEFRARADTELERVQFVPRPAPQVRGDYDVAIVPDDVETCCWLALLILLDERASRYQQRLGRCGAPRCGRFNLTFEGRPRRHCSDAHRRRYDKTLIAKRVKEWRDRQKARRRQRRRE